MSFDENNNSLIISPNPFSSSFSAHWNSSSPFSEIEIIDALGRVLITKNLEGNVWNSGALHLPAGNYELIVRSGNSILRTTIVCLP